MAKKPEVHSSRILHKGFFELKEDLLQRSDGLTHPYTSLILSSDATVILAQDNQGLWILNREYRHPTGKVLLSCPGGRLEPQEDPIQGGQREFFEETGYWSDQIQLIGTSYPFPGLCNQKIYFLLAKGAYKRGEQKLDPFEFIETVLKTDAELQLEIQQGTHIDSILCAALWYAQAF